MFWTILALISLVVLGGFIAYYGDLQGRRWGKKRVSWFGLRPKHTAILITSLTGAFIVLFSIATLLLIVPSVRDIVLRGEQAITESKHLNARLAQEQLANSRHLAEVRSKLQQAEGLLTTNTQKLEAQQAQLQRVDKDNRDLIDKNMSLQTATHWIETKLKEEKVRLAKLQTIQKKLTLVNAHLARANNSITQNNDRAASANKELSEENYKFSRLNVDLDKQNQQLLADYDGLTKRTEQLALESDELKRANEILRRSNNDQILANQEQIRETEEKLSALKEKLEGAYTQLAGTGQTFNQAYNALRQGKLNLRIGAELGRRTLDAHLRPEAVQRELNNLLTNAGITAQRLGATVGENGRAVRIVSKRVVTLSGEQDADEKASLGALASNLVGNDTPVVVLVNVVNNSVEGEQVIVELSARPVSHLFAKGDVVASRRIPTGLTVERVVDHILQFLHNDVRDAAIQAGTIPQIDPETGARQVGIIGPADLVILAERVRRIRGPVLLSAVAAESLTSADPLRLTFLTARAPTDEKVRK